MRLIISTATAVVLFGTSSIVAQEQTAVEDQVVTQEQMIAQNQALPEEPVDDLGINIGGLSIKNEGDISMKNPTFGVTYKMNSLSDFKVKPRVDFEYVNVKDDPTVTGFVKGSINAVYDVYQKKDTTPYVLAGVGYEHVKNEASGRLDSHSFVQAGAGLSHKTKDGYKLSVEGKVLQILGAEGQDNEVILTTGVSMPVGNACPIKISGPDQDRDGVLDSIDQCPDTPCYFVVDQYGCPIKATLRIHFHVDKYSIKSESLPKVEEFARYLVSHTDSTIKIVGHTDSDGSDAYNMKLSLNRAKSVLNKLVELGVAPSRLTYDGRGEREPVSTNKTVNGKALNRRIEAKLTYPNRKGN